MTIRRATSADIGSLNALAAANGSVKAPDYFPACLAEQDAARRELYIIAADGTNAGYGMLNWHPQYSLYKRLGIPEIQDLNVIPLYRCNGMASALIGHCEAAARARGCTQMGISVGLYSDYGAAQRLYVKRGYVPDGFGVTYDRETVRPGEFRPVDDNLCLMMVRDL